jgi:hypothetical protein
VVPQTYVRSANGGALRQGEILTNFTQYQLDVDRLRAQEPIEVVQISHPYVVVLSQDCDLDQDYTRRQNNKIDNLLASVLLCSVAVNDDEFRHGIGLNTKEWKKVMENREPRLHYLRAVPQADDAHNEGAPDLIVDFRQYFSLPTLEAYLCAEAARRRCRLDTPYAEHLSQRFIAYMGRVALPLDHHLPLPAEAPAAVQGTAAAPAVVEGAAAQAPAAGNGHGAPVAAPQQPPIAAGPAQPVPPQHTPGPGAPELTANRPNRPL